MKKGTMVSLARTILSVALLCIIVVNTCFAEQLSSVVKADVDKTFLIPEKIYVGLCIVTENGVEIVIDVNEDGSFRTIPIEENVRNKSCQHLHLVQDGSAVYVTSYPSQNSSVCYYNKFKCVYRCTDCGTKRLIYTTVPVQHVYSNGKCVKCGKRLY